eukprot:PhM_4_TR3216/c0_g1_i1/m.102209
MRARCGGSMSPSCSAATCSHSVTLASGEWSSDASPEQLQRKSSPIIILISGDKHLRGLFAADRHVSTQPIPPPTSVKKSSQQPSPTQAMDAGYRYGPDKTTP